MAQAAPQTRIDVLVEIGRATGAVAPPGEPALALAQAVARLTQLRFAGLQAFRLGAAHAQRGAAPQAWPRPACTGGVTPRIRRYTGCFRCNEVASGVLRGELGI